MHVSTHIANTEHTDTGLTIAAVSSAIFFFFKYNALFLPQAKYSAKPTELWNNIYNIQTKAEDTDYNFITVEELFISKKKKKCAMIDHA